MAARIALSFSIAPPFNDVSYVTANFRSQQFFRIPGWEWLDQFPLSVTTNLGWSNAFGDTTAVPPHRHVFTGGSDSVRGFRDGTLGPRDSLGNPYGGDAGMSAQFEAIIPLPAKFQTSARLSLFYDIGQSFYLGDTDSAIAAATAPTIASISASCAVPPASPCSGCRPWACSAFRGRCRCATSTRRGASSAMSSNPSSFQSERRSDA